MWSHSEPKRDAEHIFQGALDWLEEKHPVPKDKFNGEQREREEAIEPNMIQMCVPQEVDCMDEVDPEIAGWLEAASVWVLEAEEEEGQRDEEACVERGERTASREGMPFAECVQDEKQEEDKTDFYSECLRVLLKIAGKNLVLRTAVEDLMSQARADRWRPMGLFDFWSEKLKDDGPDMMVLKNVCLNAAFVGDDTKLKNESSSEESLDKTPKKKKKRRKRGAKKRSERGGGTNSHEESAPVVSVDSVPKADWKQQLRAAIVESVATSVMHCTSQIIAVIPSSQAEKLPTLQKVHADTVSDIKKGGKSSVFEVVRELLRSTDLPSETIEEELHQAWEDVSPQVEHLIQHEISVVNAEIHKCLRLSSISSSSANRVLSPCAEEEAEDDEVDDEDDAASSSFTA